MGAYVEFTAKIGFEDKINEAYALQTGKKGAWIVYSDAVIRSEIAYIHSPKGDDQAHMRPWLKTVENWNAFFPSMKTGMGSVKVSGLEENDLEAIDEVNTVLKFLRTNGEMFKKISGLDSAHDYGFTV